MAPRTHTRSVRYGAREKGTLTHMDGARLLNATVATGIAPKAYAESFDTLWIDLSKGLGAPVGAVLAGASEFYL